MLSSRLPYHLNIDYNYPSGGNQSNIENKFCEGKKNWNIVSAGESRNVSVTEGPYLYMFIVQRYINYRRGPGPWKSDLTWQAKNIGGRGHSAVKVKLPFFCRYFKKQIVNIFKGDIYSKSKSNAIRFILTPSASWFTLSEMERVVQGRCFDDKHWKSRGKCTNH